jgi:primosomal protein N' (replication factor Y) (superfamily II helicase)
LYAEIIIPLALPKNYTWLIPEQFRSIIKPGCRAEVSLKNKKYAGIVKKLHNNKPAAFEPKEILNLLDSEPIIYPHQLQLWEWIANYYLCSEGEVMAAALPAHFKLSSESVLIFNEEYGDDFSALGHDEYLVAEALLLKKELKLTEVQQILDSAHVYPVIKKLIDKKVCFVWEALKETYSPKKETYVLLNPQFDNEENLSALINEDKKLQRAEKQMELLLAYLHLQKTQGEVTKTELLKKSRATDPQLKGLVEKSILFLEKRNIDRLKYLPRNIEIDFIFSAAQQEASEKISRSFLEKQVCLLHGITSSGKTQVYVKLIEEYIKQGKQVLYLLPEIALTSQIIRRLQKHFGGYIGIYHSKFSQNERMEIWNKIKNGELKIVLGVRSSLFLPFENLGLIVVDEEHDPSYKQQEPAPRYHARDAAVYYASLFNAKVLLGSATPSVESYFNATNNKYALVELNERFGNIELPVIEIADTKKILDKEKNKIIITSQLQEAINESLQNNKQVILFQNRRGYSPYQICKICGWIPHCKNCDVSLTYHKLSNKLQCHYCGTVYPTVTTCAACGNHNFIQRNFGTEKIEEHLEDIFPKAKIARMDIDSIRGKSAHDNLIQQFEQKKIDILVGTQMVVKGLDFDNVDLVGIVDADSILSFADFRVNERGFQLMEQVSGRAGRKDKQGKVLIQAANIKHPVLAYVAKHDYKLFYENEIEGRKNFFYPPFSRIIMITFKHKIKDVVETAAHVFANNIKNDLERYLSGPAEPVVNRIRNQFIMELLFKLPKDARTINFAKTVIQQQTAILHNDKKFRSVVIIPDVDAV